MKRYLAFLLIISYLYGCAPPVSPGSDTLAVTSINPSMIDDDYSNVITIIGSGFIMLDDVYFQLGGISGPVIDPLLNIQSDTQMTLSLRLADASNSSTNADWNLILVTNGNVLIQPFTNIVIKEYYVKNLSSGTSGSGSWWALYTFSDNSSLVLEHPFYQSNTIVQDMARGDVNRIQSISNNMTFSTIYHSYSILLNSTEGQEPIFNITNIIDMPSNGQIVWEN